MSSFQPPPHGFILCCLCGLSILPNPAAMCIQCLQSQPEYSNFPAEPKFEIFQCGKCDKWCFDHSFNHWQSFELESNGLLTACMKKIPGLYDTGIKIIDAAWIWTEPHSRRLKFYVDVERPIFDNKMVIKQRIIGYYTIRMQQCINCIHEASEHSWGALIQFRHGSTSQSHNEKKKSNSSTSSSSSSSHPILSYVESLLIKSKLVGSIKDVNILRDGMDLYFSQRSNAEKVCDFLMSSLPCRSKVSKKLVSRDLQSNTSRTEHTIHLEMVPLGRYDLVLVPRSGYTTVSKPFFLVRKLSSVVHLIHPETLQKLEVSATKYFQHPLTVLALGHKHLVTFVVLDITPLNTASVAAYQGKSLKGISQRKDRGDTASVATAATDVDSSGGVLAEAVVARESDMGENDQMFTVITHLGHVLSAGDVAMGFDLNHMVLSQQQEEELAKLAGVSLPDIILVSKAYPEKDKANKRAKSKRVPPWRRDRAIGADTASVADASLPAIQENDLEDDAELLLNDSHKNWVPDEDEEEEEGSDDEGADRESIVGEEGWVEVAGGEEEEEEEEEVEELRQAT